jgi:hypothetical protein
LISDWGFVFVSIGADIIVTYLVIDQLLLHEERNAWKAVEDKVNQMIQTELETVFIHLGLITGAIGSLSPGQNQQDELFDEMKKLAEPSNLATLESNLVHMGLFKQPDDLSVVNALSISARRLGELQLRFSVKFLDPELMHFIIDLENYLLNIDKQITLGRAIINWGVTSTPSVFERGVARTLQSLIKLFGQGIDNDLFKLPSFSKGGTNKPTDHAATEPQSANKV